MKTYFSIHGVPPPTVPPPRQARAQMVATYALCGFSNIASIGTVLGTMGAMCPRRMKVFSKVYGLIDYGRITGY